MTLHAPAARLRTVDLAYVALFAVLIAVCAWISIPATIPFTLQTFGIFAALTILGGRRGTYATVVYLLLGAVGLPVFSGFQAGIGTLLGATGGFILGFAAQALVYWLITAHLGTSVPAMAAAGVISLAGTIWFLTVYAQSTGPVSLGTALGWCVIPFILPDLGKLALAIALSLRLKKFLH